MGEVGEWFLDILVCLRVCVPWVSWIGAGLMAVFFTASNIDSDTQIFEWCCGICDTAGLEASKVAGSCYTSRRMIDPLTPFCLSAFSIFSLKSGSR